MTSGWDQASTILIGLSAVATASLAAYTARPAKKTERLSASAEKEANAVVEQGAAITAQANAVAAQAAAASDQAELTCQTLAVSVQPLLTLGEPPEQGHWGPLDVVRVPISERNPEERLLVSLRVRNVGSGVAIIDPKHSHVVGWPSDRSNDAQPRDYSSGTVEDPILPAGEQTSLQFNVALQRWLIDYETLTGQHRNDGEFWVDVAYGDALGFELTVAHLHVARNKVRKEWRIFEIDYFTPPNASDPRMTVRF